MNQTINLYSLRYSQIKTYLFGALFVAGNIVLPQLCHLIPFGSHNGGQILLPIYFFTLIAAYKYGFSVGLLTALLSPLCNYLLFGMPAAHMLPVLIVKSALLALAAAFAAHYFKNISFIGILLAVLAYQIIGTGVEYLLSGSAVAAFQDFRVGVPGMLLQIAGGYFVLKAIARK